MVGGVGMNRVKDIAIIVLVSAVVYLLATRDSTVALIEPAGSSMTSIAVLPYVNMSGDVESGNLSDSLWEETINSLAKVPGVRVASRSSLPQFASSYADVRKIGETLGVSYVVEGAIARSDSGVRITAQLIRVNDGTHVWSDIYDRDLASAKSVPVAISQSVTREINSL